MSDKLIPMMRAATIPDRGLVLLTSADRLLLMYFVGKGDDDRISSPSTEEIRRETKFTAHILAASLNKLIDCGYLDCQRRRQATNVYEVIDPEGLIYGIRSEVTQAITLDLPWEKRT